MAGDSCKDTARQLNISSEIVEVHRRRIEAKLGAKNSSDLIRTMLTKGYSPKVATASDVHSVSEIGSYSSSHLRAAATR